MWKEPSYWLTVKSVQQASLLFGKQNGILSTPHRRVECFAAECCKKTVSFAAGEVMAGRDGLWPHRLHGKNVPQFAAPSTDPANDRPEQKRLGQKAV